MSIEVTPELRERIARVRVLLQTDEEWVPGPPTMRLGDLPGPAPSKRVPHEECKGKGCPACASTGLRRARKGDEPWDEYLEMPLSEASLTIGGTFDLTADYQRLGAELARLEADAARREGRIDHERFGWERTKQAYERAGSYRELRRVLGKLREWWPEGYNVIRAAYYVGVSVELTRREGMILDMAEAWVAHTMRGPVRVPPWVDETLAKQKVETVETLAEKGLTAGAIARRLRLPKEKVRRVLKGLAKSGGVRAVA